LPQNQGAISSRFNNVYAPAPAELENSQTSIARLKLPQQSQVVQTNENNKYLSNQRSSKEVKAKPVQSNVNEFNSDGQRPKTEARMKTAPSPVKRSSRTPTIQKKQTPIKISLMAKELGYSNYKSTVFNEYDLPVKSPRYTTSGIEFVNEMYSNINRVLAKNRV
jgi:hypothetical protein